MKNFAYLDADSFAAASKALASGEGHVAKAAGTDLLGLLKSRIVEPEAVVNLRRIKDEERRGEINALSTGWRRRYAADPQRRHAGREPRPGDALLVSADARPRVHQAW